MTAATTLGVPLPPVHEIARTKAHPAAARVYWRWEASDLRRTAAWEFKLSRRQPDLAAERRRSALAHVRGARQCLAAAASIRAACPTVRP